MGLDPISWAAIAATVVSTGSSIVQGSQQRKEAKKQAMLAEQNANEAAALEKENANTALRQQKMTFLKSGVTLAGSPLLIMQETFERGERNARSQVRSGSAQAGTLRAQGNAAFASGVSDGFRTAGSAVLRGYDMGMFGGQPAQKPGADPSVKGQPAGGTNFDPYQTA